MLTKNPIPISIERLSEYDYLASAVDAELYASGDTEEEAIENLEDIIAGTYRLLKSLPTKKLGPEPFILLDYLNSHDATVVKVTLK